MRFEVEATLATRRFKYAISLEMPENFREARVAEEELSVDGHVVFSRHQAQVSVDGGPTFGVDWHVAALPVIEERPRKGSIQQFKEFSLPRS